MKKNIVIVILMILCVFAGCFAFYEWKDNRIELYDEEYSYIKLSGHRSFNDVDVESEIPSESFTISNETAVKIGVAVLEEYIEPEELEQMSIGLMDIESRGFYVVGAYYEGILDGGTSVAILKKNGKILKVFGGG